MKKSYLMIVAAAALFSACADNDNSFTDKPEKQTMISFSTFSQKATKAENSSKTYTWSLSDHHSDFKVWGYKNTSATAVFNGEKVLWNTDVDPDAWTYVDNRYWDKAATAYNFYACAPYEDTPFTFNGVTTVATQDAGYFTITSAYSKAGENVSPKNATTSVQSWKNATTDVDLMIADVANYSGTALTGAYTGKVTLNFIHILSRLNITVKTTDDFLTTGDKIKVTNITVGHMKNSGTFNESSATGRTLADGTSTRWTATGDKDYSYDINYNVTQAANYVIETLIIPQKAGLEAITLDGSKVTADGETMPYLKVAYTIYNNDESKSEDFVAFYNLASLFGVTSDSSDPTLAFNEGWQNTLNITIAPGAIKFDAKVAPWADNATGAVTVD